MGEPSQPPLRLRRAISAIGLCSLLVGCGAPAGPALPEAPLPTAAAVAMPAPRAAEEPLPGRPDIDYIAVGGRELLAAVEPLLAHREAKGLTVERIAIEDLLARRPRDPSVSRAILWGINSVAARSGARLRFVLLVGDAPGLREQVSGFVPVPAFYRPKVGYENHRPDDHDHARIDEHDHAAQHQNEVFATDLPYAYANRGAAGRPELAAENSPEPLAVGRIPARAAREARDFAKKVIDYENDKSEGAWRRKIHFLGGPANFGRMIDAFIEGTTTAALDAAIPYDYDVGVIFPKLGSPYSVPFNELPARIVKDLNQGALIAAYVGHGGYTSFDDVHFRRRHYDIAGTRDLEDLQIRDGKPFYVSITCNNGAYDLEHTRGVAEVLTLNPGGAIAAFASSRESHPYSNALLGQAVVEVFLQGRPKNIGEGILDVKRRMLDGSIPLAPILFEDDAEELNAEHEGLYNLFGDPATELQYPWKAEVALAGAPTAVAPGAVLHVTVASPAVPSGTAALTIETRRSVIRGKLIPAEAIEKMTEREAWAAMSKNYATAIDKVVARDNKPIANARSSFSIKAPKAPGEYEIKVFASGSGHGAAAGHLRVRVEGPLVSSR
jgi:hypothetical protein